MTETTNKKFEIIHIELPEKADDGTWENESVGKYIILKKENNFQMIGLSHFSFGVYGLGLEYKNRNIVKIYNEGSGLGDIKVNIRGSNPPVSINDVIGGGQYCIGLGGKESLDRIGKGPYIPITKRKDKQFTIGSESIDFEAVSMEVLEQFRKPIQDYCREKGLEFRLDEIHLSNEDFRLDKPYIFN